MGTVNLNDQRAQVEILRWCKAREAEIADMKAQARAAVEAALGDNDAGTIDGELAITWRTQKRKALDQKALKEHEPEIHESYTKTTEVRRFEVFGG
jgi:predicted phage-related endonuclease